MQAWAIVEAGDELPDNGRTMATDKQEREEGGRRKREREKDERRQANEGGKNAKEEHKQGVGSSEYDLRRNNSSHSTLMQGILDYQLKKLLNCYYTIKSHQNEVSLDPSKRKQQEQRRLLNAISCSKGLNFSDHNQLSMVGSEYTQRTGKAHSYRTISQLISK